MAVIILDNPGTSWAINGQPTPVPYTSGVNNGNNAVTITSGATCCRLTIYYSNNSGTVNTTTIAWSGNAGDTYILLQRVTGTDGVLEVWGCVNPTPAVGGTFTINFTGNGGSSRVSVNHTTWTGTATSSVAAAFKNLTVTNTGTAASPSVAVTTVSGDVAAVIFCDDSNTSGGWAVGQTQIYNSASGRVNFDEYSAAVSSTTTLTGTGGGTATLLLGMAISQGAAATTGVSVIIGLASAEW